MSEKTPAEAAEAIQQAQTTKQRLGMRTHDRTSFKEWVCRGTQAMDDPKTTVPPLW